MPTTTQTSDSLRIFSAAFWMRLISSVGSRTGRSSQPRKSLPAPVRSDRVMWASKTSLSIASRSDRETSPQTLEMSTLIILDFVLSMFAYFTYGMQGLRRTSIRRGDHWSSGTYRSRIRRRWLEMVTRCCRTTDGRPYGLGGCRFFWSAKRGVFHRIYVTAKMA